MHSNLTIQNELKELNSILAGISNTNVYTVPDGYFEAMALDILNTLQQVSGISPNAAVPEGYFEGLADGIMNKIKDGLAMKDEGSALLSTVKNVNPYTVPHGYFEALAGNIVNQLPQPAKVIVMRKRSSFFNYAAAAVITGILGLSVVSIVDKRQQDKILSETAALNLNFDEALANVSDDDIVAYLQKGGEDVNAALVASASEDKNLPEQVDYLTDDKTLDNLLNELNIKDQSTTN